MVNIKKVQKHLAVDSGTRLMATTLAAGTLTVLAIFLIFATYQLSIESRLQKAQLERHIESIGASTAWGVENWLTERVKMAEQIAYELGQLEDINEAVNNLRSPVFESTFIWTYFGEANGTYHIWPLDDELPDDYDPRTRPWYLAAVKEGRTTLTEPYFDITTGVETITVATPVYRDGKLLGVVGADFSTETLSDVLRKTNLGGLGQVYLVSSEGKMLAHPNRNNISRNLRDIYAADVPVINSDIQYLNKLAAPKVVTFVKIPAIAAINWSLGICVEQHRAFQNLNEFRQLAAIATLAAAVLMVLVLGFVIHRLLVRPLNQARLAADAANVAKSEFLASMSHEIRTPMNGVLGMAEVLSNSGLDAKQKELASIITSSGNALMTVINDILDISKLDAGKLRICPVGFNLRKTVFEVTTMMQARALEKDIELIVRYAPTLPEGVVGDDSRLRQVLGNLIGNAVKFTEHGYVLVEVDGDRVGEEVDLTISIRDTGIGISEDQLPRMFEKFEQADSSHTRRYGGTGLGLAISRNIVELMGGEITAESVVDQGSCFRVWLRLPVDETVVSLPPCDKQIFDDVRILAVDDNAINRRVIKELMDGWSLRSTVVESPVRALAALERAAIEGDQYDIALLDHQMPGEDGISLAKRMKQDDRFSSLPIIILSSINGVDNEDNSQGAIIAASLAKPVRPSQLMDCLARLLSEQAAAQLRETAQRARQEAAACVPAPRASDAGGRKKVLVAEDNMVNQMVIKTFINDEKFEIILAENGEQAVDLFKKHEPDIVLMDLSMPVLGGLEATQQIRDYETAEKKSATPIIATTAHVMQEDRDRCAAAGMDDFLAKPIKKGELDRMMTQWLAPEEVDSALSA
ncbi:hybrid sensor histidine kinase/response regulator [Hyphococcus sp.]|uniref:hybrid sensor histidine kinase/response regulator n=1 Tax=Hyphococcus sp. TaxID=2038636 RepID=UPI00207EB097|nr:MAG: hypothetical protein DHS20C04_13600 [Marinicaulis sp.]